MATDWTFLKELGQISMAINTKGKFAHAVFVQLNSFSFKSIIMAAAALGRFSRRDFEKFLHRYEGNTILEFLFKLFLKKEKKMIT